MRDSTERGERGVGVRSLHEQLDTSSGTSRLTMHIFAALAQFSVIWTEAGGRAQIIEPG